MAVTSKVYGSAQRSLGNKEVDLDSDNLMVMLCAAAYTPNQVGHRYKSDVSSEVSGTGYTAGGQALTGVTVSYASNVLTLDCADPVWSGSTITARYAVFYDATPATDATRPLLCYWDLGSDQSSTAGPFTLTIAATGLITFTAA